MTRYSILQYHLYRAHLQPVFSFVCYRTHHLTKKGTADKPTKQQFPPHSTTEWICFTY